MTLNFLNIGIRPQPNVFSPFTFNKAPDKRAKWVSIWFSPPYAQLGDPIYILVDTTNAEARG